VRTRSGPKRSPMSARSGGNGQSRGGARSGRDHHRGQAAERSRPARGDPRGGDPCTARDLGGRIRPHRLHRKICSGHRPRDPGHAQHAEPGGCGHDRHLQGKHATDAHLDTARRLFDTVGRTVVVDEKHMDCRDRPLGERSGISSTIILESLAEAGVKVGLPRDIATVLAAQTLFGAAKVQLDTGDPPRAAQGCRHDAGGLHHRRHPGARRGQAACDPHQGRGEGHATRERADVRESRRTTCSPGTAP